MKKLLFAAAALIASPVVAEPVAITGGKLVVGDGSAPIDNGVVVIDDGSVVAVGGPNTAIPAGATIFAARGKWVTPGIVASFSRIGLSEVDLSASGSDDTGADDSPHSAAIDASWGVNPNATPIEVSRADGITRALVAPTAEKTIFAGRGAMIDTASDFDPVTKRFAFQLVHLGELGANRAGGSRSAAFLQLAEAMAAARSGSLRAGPDDSLLTQADIEALAPVVRGEEPLIVQVERAVDIVNVLSLKQDYPQLDLILMGVSEGHLVVREIAAAGVPVIAEPTLNRPGSFEQLASTQSNIGRLRAAGVTVAAALLSDFVNRNARNQRQLAGNLVALTRVPGHQGVSWEDAFAMISSVPASLVGVEAGALRPGYKADVVVWSGDPLELSSAAEKVWIDGVEQNLENHQTRLRDRYRSLAPSSMPKAYEK